MRCTAHPFEPGVGVCASCLRDRLLALTILQNDLAAAAAHQYRLRRGPDSPPIPPISASASPFAAHRRSDGFLPRTPHPAAPTGRRSSPFSALFDRPPSWISNLIRGPRRREKSPAMEFSPFPSGTPAWWPGGMPTPTPTRRSAAAAGNGGGFAGCLSPLVWASPRLGRRSWAAAEAGFAGDPRRRSVGGGPGLATNRSRKLAGDGRFK